MRKSSRVVADRYVDIEYYQFTQSTPLRVGIRLVGFLTWPLVLPLSLLSRLSDLVFFTFSQALAVVPFLLGTIMRYEFYRFTLRRCGTNVMIGFGTVFLYRDVAIGDHVLIGMYNTVHHCDFGSYVLTAEGCRFLSGGRHHNFDRTDVPMALQGGKVRRIVSFRRGCVGAAGGGPRGRRCSRRSARQGAGLGEGCGARVPARRELRVGVCCGGRRA